MEFIKDMFIDSDIVSCFEKRFGSNCSLFLGFIYRLLELGIVSGLPPFIVIYTHTKYKTVIAAVVSFFGMKFFKKLIEALSEDSIPTQLKKLRESNDTILMAISNLPEEVQQKVKDEIAKVNKESVERERQITNDQFSVVRDDIRITNDQLSVVRDDVDCNLSAIRDDIDCNLSAIRDDIDSIRPMQYAPYDSPSNGEDAPM